MDLFTLPTPYPDETWYSIVARYHRHSGNILSAETRRELFGEPMCGSINPVEMDASIVNYVRIHGNALGTDEECFSKYTLAAYHLRYYSEKRKEEILSRIRDSKSKTKTNVFTRHADVRKRTLLRYCPICLQEDNLKYGEAYWHRAHQIWIVDKCYKHQCKLHASTVSLSKASFHFSCADEAFCPDRSIIHEESVFDKLSPYVITTLDAPFTFHTNAITDALIYAAIDAGYGEFTSKGFTCKAAQLYSDIQGCFGTEFVKSFFTADDAGATIRRVFYPHWNSRVEPAILVAAFLQISINELFKKEDRETKIREEFAKCAQYGFRWPRAKLAQHLGVKESRLDALAKESGIPPFWGFQTDKGDLVEIRARFCVTEEEKNLIDERVREMHAANRKEFILYCVRKELTSLDH